MTCTQGQLCVLAEDCNQPDYKKLVEALCAEHNVSLISVPEAKQLGQWAGVSCVSMLESMFANKCSCMLIRHSGMPSHTCIGRNMCSGVQLCKIDSEGEARKVVGCSSVVVTDYGEENEGRSVLEEYLKNVRPSLFCIRDLYCMWQWLCTLGASFCHYPLTNACCCSGADAWHMHLKCS